MKNFKTNFDSSLFALLALIVLLAAGCKKEEISKEIPDVDFVIPLESPSNPENPYDYVGEIHNDALDYFESMIDIVLLHNDDLATLEEIMQDSLLDFLRNHPETAPGTYDGFEFGILSQDFHLEIIIDSSFESNGAKDYVLNSVEFAKQNVPSSSADVNAFMEASKIVVSQIIGDSSISSNDRQVLLESYSVLTYSLYYWADVMRDEDSGWNPILSDPNPGKTSARWFTFVTTAFADFIGGSIGSGFGPGGTVAGASIASGLWAASLEPEEEVAPLDMYYEGAVFP